MSNHGKIKNKRILIVDDNKAIHDDFKKILGVNNNLSDEICELEKSIFGDSSVSNNPCEFELDSAFQGQEALEMVRESYRQQNPYAVAFVDVRMPPGWDGIETITHIWAEFPEIQIVICTAYSDYSWLEIIEKFGDTEKLLILKKPFDSVEVRQMAITMTEKWNLSKEVDRHIHQLEDMVRARTCDLEKANQELTEEIDAHKKARQKLENTQSQLIQSEKLASIGQLAAGVAHEINNPIAYVMSNTQTLKKYITTFTKIIDLYREEGHREEIAKQERTLNLDFIRDDIGSLIDDNIEGLQKVKEIVNNLKSFSRSNEISDLKPTNLNDCINNTLVVAKNELKYHIQIETDLQELPEILANEGQLNQVILNILVNASQAIKERKDNPEGKILIKSYTDDNHIYVSIIDDGPGIPREIINKIFDPFFTTKEVGHGTGLGLNISYDIIVNKHKGNLLVESEVGKGSQFIIKLPKVLKMEDTSAS